MRFVIVLALALLLPGLPPGLRPAVADSLTPAQREEVIRIVRDALRSDPSILRDGLLALQSDEDRSHERATGDAIARLGQQLHDPADPVEGNLAGTTTIVEFFDTRCPYCRRMLPVMAELLQAEPNVKLVMKDLPILGPTSQLESRALLAAQRQGGYFRLRDALMSSNAASTRDTLRETADSLGLDGGRLLRDLDDPAIKARLEANVALAQQLAIEGTPALIIGRQMIAGAADLSELRRAIAAAR